MFKFGVFLCLAAVLAGEGLVLCNWDKSVYKIIINDKPACLATAIGSAESTRFLVTAAHCVRGVKFILKNHEDKPVTESIRVIIHPYYKPPKVNYDIALLKVDEKSDKLQLPKPAEKPTEVKVVKADLNSTEEAKVIGLKDCQTKLGNSTKLSSKMLCVSVTEKVIDGNPLMNKDHNTIFGVAFFSAQGIRVFTNMMNSEISSFIKEYV